VGVNARRVLDEDGGPSVGLLDDRRPPFIGGSIELHRRTPLGYQGSWPARGRSDMQCRSARRRRLAGGNPTCSMAAFVDSACDLPMRVGRRGRIEFARGIKLVCRFEQHCDQAP
jgi:hypothetical protein